MNEQNNLKDTLLSPSSVFHNNVNNDNQNQIDVNYVDESVKNNSYYKYDNSNVYDFFFMHRSKRIALVKLSITNLGVKALRIKILNKNDMPLPLMWMSVPNTKIEVGEASEQYRKILDSFNEWLKNRLMSVERKNIDNILKTLFGFVGPVEGLYNQERRQAFIELAAILSYGRSMTDKYWFNPVNSNKRIKTQEGLYDILCFGKPSDENLMISLGINVATTDVALRRRKDYSDMDFTKSGIASSYSSMIFNTEPTNIKHVQFNCPDFCTSGKVTKFWSKAQNRYFLEKFYEDRALLKDALTKAVTAYNTSPHIFPKPYAIKTIDDEIIGYKTECFVDGYTELISLKDLCLFKNENKELSIDKLVQNAELLGIDKLDISEFLNDIINACPDIDIFENAGIIVSCDSKEFQKFVAWV